MSGQQPSNVQSAGLSKSAAKKKAKKAAAKAASASAPAPSTTSAGLGSDGGFISADVPLTLDPNLYPSAAPGTFHPTLPPFDPSLFNFPPGAYPVDVQYETATYYDDVEVPLPGANGTGPFSLPFPLDYNSLSSFGQPNGNSLTTLASNLNITHDDLVEVANELYRRMQEPTFGQDDPYWSNLSPHVRHFIREAVPYDTQTAAAARNQQTGSLEQRMMQAMAQKIVSAASEGMGIPKNLSANILAGVGVAGVGVGVNGRAVFQGHPPQQPPAQSVAEEFGFRRHPDAPQEEEYDDEEYDLDEAEYTAGPNGDPPKKKNKKKKKKAVQEQPPVVVPPPPPPVAKQPPPRAPPAPQFTQPPVLNPPPPPPSTPAPINPLPSSRAAGKQPMPTAAGAPAVPPAAAPAPARSARAAGKAPASAVPPANHNHNHTHPHPPAKPAAKGKAPAPAPPAKIWTQSSAQDRENIRRFWLELNEAERRDLLQIEKDAVLRKMKEQHRHSCGCAVCGRKKVNIEMELDQLYEQYYDELRLYAAEQRAASGGQRAQPPGAGPFPGSVEVDAAGAVTKFDHRAPEHAYYQDDGLEEEGSELDEEYDGEDDEELDDEDIVSEDAEAGDDIDEPPPARAIRKPPARTAAPRAEGAEDFLAFGNSLATIKGILTVADDLLKNDGARFLEMMEQLAVARVVREEQNVRDMQEETDDEDYDEAEEPLTEEQKMEEGRRMFQIFAARMFEQRVLQAYREKVAKQREEQLLLELEQEENLKKNKEERKAKEAQKKKDKKRQQKEKADKDKADRDAAQAEEIAAARAKAEEAERERLKRTEEERIRREAVKKAAQEEAAKQAAERRRRQQEEKEREEEAARKKKEKEEKARKEREARDKELKEKERKEKEERAAREKAEKAEKDRLAKERAEKERVAREARDAAERERLAKLEAERAEKAEKARKEEVARKERESVELGKALAAAAKAKADKAAADKAAADRAAADKAAKAVLSGPPTASISIKGAASRGASLTRNGTTPQQTTPPMEQLSPIKSVGASRPTPSGPSTGRTPQKTPQAYFPQPIPAGSYPTRMPMGPGFNGTPGFRPPGPPGNFNPSVSPIFSPPSASNGPILSPNPPVRGFHPEPSPPFDQSRAAAIGMGFPMKPPGLSAGPSHRLSSMEEPYSDTPIGAPRSVSTGDVNHLNLSGLTLEDYRSPAAPIGAPGPSTASLAVGQGSAPGSAIGRPIAFDPSLSSSAVASSSALPSTSTPLSSSSRQSPPKGSERILGSAALLSTDDEIVSPPTRRTMNVNGWDAAPILPPAPSGASRWSAGSSIWGAGVAESPWSAPPPGGPPGLPLSHQLPHTLQHPHPLGGRQTSGSGPTSAPAPASFGGLGGGFGGAFGGGLFSPPGTAGGVLGVPPAKEGQQTQAQQIPTQGQAGQGPQQGQPLAFGNFGMSQDKYH